MASQRNIDSPTITRFSDLVEPFVLTKGVDDFGAPARHQSRAARKFVSLVSQSHLHLWKPGDPIHPSGRRVLMGVWTASRYDMSILDQLNSKLQSGRITDWIDVFNSQDLQRMDEYYAYVPGLEGMMPPVIGVWDQGSLTRSCWGPAARQWLSREYGLRTRF